MKKALIIADLHHASPRIPSFVKYFEENAWNAIIITPEYDEHRSSRVGISWRWENGIIPGGKVVITKYPGDIFEKFRSLLTFFGLRKNVSYTQQLKNTFGIGEQKRSLIDILMRTYQAFFALPDTEIPWIKYALKSARDVLDTEKIDIIVSSSPHPTTHIVASRLKKELHIPWLADFRDPWTSNHEYSFPLWRKFLESKYEVNLMNDADLLVTASPGYARRMSALHHRRFEVVTNGFDQDLLATAGLNAKKVGDKFCIVYTGKIYSENSKQAPWKFLDAVFELIKQNKISKESVSVNFYGRLDPALGEEIKKRNLGQTVLQHGVRTWKEIIGIQRSADLLLLFNWEDSLMPGVYPGKTFEYLSSGCPILATGGFRGDDIELLLKETNAGTFAVEREDIMNGILFYYNQYCNKGASANQINQNAIAQYSYKLLSKKFTGFMDEVLGEAK